MSTHNLCFGSKIRKKVNPCTTQFYNIKVGYEGGTHYTNMLFWFALKSSLCLLARQVYSDSSQLIFYFLFPILCALSIIHTERGNRRLFEREMVMRDAPLLEKHLSHVMRKPTMWFLTWSNTNQTIQAR